jgi:dihydrofolate reductase
VKDLKKKPEITAIACVSENLGIGNKGKLLFSIPEDMKYFREKTAGGTVIMGRKTLDSFPCGKPLKGRVNIVLTRDSGFVREGVIVYNDFETLKNDLESGKFGTGGEIGADGKNAASGDVENSGIFIIGGGDIYKLFLSVTDVLLLTEVKSALQCDSYFPDYRNDFINNAQTEPKIYGDLTYTFNRYERRGQID